MKRSRSSDLEEIRRQFRQPLSKRDFSTEYGICYKISLEGDDSRAKLFDVAREEMCHHSDARARRAICDAMMTLPRIDPVRFNLQEFAARGDPDWETAIETAAARATVRVAPPAFGDIRYLRAWEAAIEAWRSGGKTWELLAVALQARKELACEWAWMAHGIKEYVDGTMQREHTDAVLRSVGTFRELRSGKAV